jgi:hypothetical protein
LIYEVRVYQAHEGKAEALRARFVDEVASKFFPRHGIELVGVFVDPKDAGRLTYIARFENEEARQTAWAAFAADPNWSKVKAASEADGPLLKQQSASVLSPVVSGLVLD